MSKWMTAAMLALSVVTAAAQRPTTRVPVETPPGWPQQRADAGLPWPEGLGRREALTGHIGAIDKDQIMVRSLDLGEVLFWVDQRTVVRVDKTRLSLSDLQVGDPVAVRLKKIKGRGPYATEILPHPDVRTRVEQGGGRKATAPSAGGHGGIVPPDTASTAVPGTSTATSAAAEEPEVFPELPRGLAGVVGTVTAVSGDALELRDRNQQTQKVLVTGVTQYKRAGSDTIVQPVKAGDRVAVAGDRLDSGEWIAREVLVGGSSAAVAAGSQPGPSGGAIERGPDGLARFLGVIVALGNEEVRVRTPRGEYNVLVTGGTQVARMGIRGSFALLRKGDEVKVVGDVLEAGTIVAREITVTRLAGS